MDTSQVISAVAPGHKLIGHGLEISSSSRFEFSKWATILSYEKLVAAAVDRFIHHSQLVELNGSIKRMDTSLMPGKGKE